MKGYLFVNGRFLRAVPMVNGCRGLPLCVVGLGPHRFQQVRFSCVRVDRCRSWALLHCDQPGLVVVEGPCRWERTGWARYLAYQDPHSEPVAITTDEDGVTEYVQGHCVGADEVIAQMRGNA